MKKLLPYFLITLVFAVFIGFWHRSALTYNFNPSLVRDYLRSQDIEDPLGKIKDRVILSDSDIYIASGYLYAKGADPTAYNFQHPPLVKYLFGFSTLLTGNPYWVQMVFGLALLWLTFYLGTKLRLGYLGIFGGLGLLIDPVFGGMMNGALLDLGQAVFALGYLILTVFFPAGWLLQGIVLGLFAASKFWSTAIIFVILVMAYKIFVRKENINFKKTALSFLIAFLVLCLTYTKSFIDAGGLFNIFAFLAKDLKFMLTHNSASALGGPIILFVTGYFAPWWQAGVEKATDWTVLWPLGLGVGVVRAVREFREKNYRSFFYLLPFVYLLLLSTQVPFTRYFILILPYLYLSLSSLILLI